MESNLTVESNLTAAKSQQEVSQVNSLNIVHFITFLLSAFFLFANVNNFLSIETKYNPLLLFLVLVSLFISMVTIYRINKRLIDHLDGVTDSIFYSKLFYRVLTIIYLVFPILLLFVLVSFTAITLGWGLVIIATYFESHAIVAAFCNTFFWICLLGYFFAECLCSFPKCYSGVTRYIAIFFTLSPFIFLVCLNPLMDNLRMDLQEQGAKKREAINNLLQKNVDWKKTKLDLQIKKIIPYNQEVYSLISTLQAAVPSMSPVDSLNFGTSTERDISPTTIIWLNIKYNDSLNFNPEVEVLQKQLTNENFELIKNTMNQISALYTKTFTPEEIEFMRSNPLSRSMTICGDEGDFVCLGVVVVSEKRRCDRSYLCKVSEIENCPLYGSNQYSVCK